MAKGKIIDKDKGMRRIVKTMSANIPARLTVGWHEAKGGVPHAVKPANTNAKKPKAPAAENTNASAKAKKKKNKAAPPTVAEVASFHEFGLGVPKRSMIAATLDEHQDEYARLVKQAADRHLVGDDLTRHMARIGLRVVADVQKRIVAGIAPELQPATIERKGSSKPLIDTGQMRAALSFEVKLVKGGGDE